MKLHRVTELLDVNDANLSGSKFADVNLSGSDFSQINFAGASFLDCNLSGWRINDVNLAGTRIEAANLSGVVFNNCRWTNATINGVAVQDLLDAYEATNAPR